MVSLALDMIDLSCWFREWSYTLTIYILYYDCLMQITKSISFTLKYGSTCTTFQSMKKQKPCKLCNSLVIWASQLLETVAVFFGEVYVFYLTLYFLKSSKRLTKCTLYYDYRMTLWKSWLVLTLYFMKSSKRLT